MTRVEVKEVPVRAIGALVVEADGFPFDMPGALHVDSAVLPSNGPDEGMTNAGNVPCQDVDFLVDPHRAYILPCVRT